METKNRKTLVLVASMILVVPFVLLLFAAMFHVFVDEPFEKSTLGKLLS